MQSPKTPSKGKTKKIPPCENVELEFTQRFLSLFTSFYDTPSTTEILTFPPAPPDPSGELTSQSTGKIAPFHSGACDMRLRKAVDARQANDALTSESLSEQVLQLRDSLAADTPELTEIFAVEKTPRPEIPLYIQNIEKDKRAFLDSFKPPRKNVQPLKLDETQKLFSEKLKVQKAIAKERQKKRFVRANEMEKQYKEFTMSLPKSKFSESHEQETFERNKQRQSARRKLAI